MIYHPTQFLESNALLSMQAKDSASVYDALSAMSPHELADLSLVCGALENAIAHMYAEKTGEHIFNAPSWRGENPYKKFI